jgi:glutathione synthase/RimK-type ligase-like ATP-grasp enzyme
MKNKINCIFIVRDYRSKFWLTARNYSETYDLLLLKKLFEELSYSVIITNFSKIDLLHTDYSNAAIFYQSSEDKNLFYKSFIEDIILGLKMKGALVIPDFHYLRAHHNKVFMEILRQVSKLDCIKNLQSQYFGTYEEFDSKNISFPSVFKLSEGAQSSNVRLLKDLKQTRSIIRWYSKSFDITIWLKDLIKYFFFRKKYDNYIKTSQHRKKYILQEFIPSLKNDYKVVVINRKFFVLERYVRHNDFRASGSGKFKFNSNIPLDLLNYAKEIFEYFKVPFISLDIAYFEKKSMLLEFQFVSFGTITVEKSPYHFEFNDGAWKLIEGKVIIEEDFVQSIDNFIKSNE